MPSVTPGKEQHSDATRKIEYATYSTPCMYFVVINDLSLILPKELIRHVMDTEETIETMIQWAVT